MNDPHVVWLQYRLGRHEETVYDAPPAIEDETDSFRINLADGLLTVTMKEHYATAESAKDAVRDYLQAWEISTGLASRRLGFRFEFVRAEIIDRDPPPPGTIVGCGGIVFASAAMIIKGHAVRKEYPKPPAEFRASGAVRKLWLRFEAFLRGQEPLASMAYACLTLILASAGKNKERAKAAQLYNVEEKVLSTLSMLTSIRGGPSEARKFNAGATGAPFSDQEKQWIMEAVRALIQQKARADFDPTMSLPRISMATLPAL